MADKKNEPAFKASFWPVSVAVWKNESKEGPYYTVGGPTRSYKTDKGEWKHTDSLRVNDVPKAVILLNKAYEEALVMQSALAQDKKE